MYKVSFEVVLLTKVLQNTGKVNHHLRSMQKVNKLSKLTFLSLVEQTDWFKNCRAIKILNGIFLFLYFVAPSKPLLLGRASKESKKVNKKNPTNIHSSKMYQ